MQSLPEISYGRCRTARTVRTVYDAYPREIRGVYFRDFFSFFLCLPSSAQKTFFFSKSATQIKDACGKKKKTKYLEMFFFFLTSIREGQRCVFCKSFSRIFFYIVLFQQSRIDSSYTLGKKNQ